MAYASSVNEPFEMTSPGLAQTPIGGGVIANSSVAAARPRQWGYLSTADALTSVTAASYFSDGYKRGMRPGDAVMIVNSTSTATSSSLTVTWAAVTNYSTASGGVSLSTAAFQN